MFSFIIYLTNTKHTGGKSEMWRLYVHTNKVNGKRYVGITSTTMAKRCHRGEGYKPPVDGSSPFYNAIQKYGWDNFRHEVLFENLTREEACNLERLMIKKLESHVSTGKGYNITWGGEGTNGRVVTQETRDKISKANKGKKHTDEARAKMSERSKGRRHSFESRVKVGVKAYIRNNPEVSPEDAWDIVKENIERKERDKVEKAQRFGKKETRLSVQAKKQLLVDEMIENAEELYKMYY